MLHHEQADHALPRVYPVGGAEIAAPGKAAGIAGIAGRGPLPGDGETQTEIVVYTEREVQLSAGHELAGAGRQNLPAVIAAAIQDHLEEDRIVEGRGGKAGTAG